MEDENEDCSKFIFDFDDQADEDNAIEESEERSILEEVGQTGELEEPSKMYIDRRKKNLSRTFHLAMFHFF